MTNLTIANNPEGTNARRSRLTDIQFIQLWNTSSSVDEFCNRTAEHRNGEPMKKQSAYSRSRALREAGVPLKTFQRRAHKDYAALAEMAASLLSEEVLQATTEAMERRRQAVN